MLLAILVVCIAAICVWWAIRVGRQIGYFLPAPTNAYEQFHRDALRKLKWRFFDEFYCNRFRNEGVARFAWAIPNQEAISAIINTVPPNVKGTIVDLGAGSGFWPMLLSRQISEQKRNIKIVAFEKSLNLYAKRKDGSIGIRGAKGAKRSDLWFNVQPGDEDVMVRLQRSDRIHTLVLIWPPCWEDMAFEAVQAFNGDIVVYVGEERGGCTVGSFSHPYYFTKLKSTQWRKWRK